MRSSSSDHHESKLAPTPLKGVDSEQVEIPFYTSPPSDSAALTWLDNQLTSEGRFIAKKILANINHVSFERYVAALKKTVEDFQQKIDGPFVIVVSDELAEKDQDLSCSRWLANLAVAAAGLREPYRMIELTDLIRYIRYEPQIKHIVMFYDCPLTISHLTQVLRDVLEKEKGCTLKDRHFYLGMPFSRRDDRERIAIESAMSFGGTALNQHFKSISLLASENIPLLYDLLTAEEFERINQGYCRHYYNIRQADLTYFDHFYPENNRTLPHLQTGEPLALPDKNIIPIHASIYDFIDKPHASPGPQTQPEWKPVVPHIIRLFYSYHIRSVRYHYNKRHLQAAAQAMSDKNVGNPVMFTLPDKFNKLLRNIVGKEVMDKNHFNELYQESKQQHQIESEEKSHSLPPLEWFDPKYTLRLKYESFRGRVNKDVVDVWATEWLGNPVEVRDCVPSGSTQMWSSQWGSQNKHPDGVLLQDTIPKFVSLEKMRLPHAIVPHFYGYARDITYVAVVTQRTTSLKHYFVVQKFDAKQHKVKAYDLAKRILEKMIVLNQYGLQQGDLNLENILLTQQNEIVFWPSSNFQTVTQNFDLRKSKIFCRPSHKLDALVEDVYRFGLLLWSLFSPLSDVSGDLAKIPAEVPLKIVKLIKCCRLSDSKARITVNELLSQLSGKMDLISSDLMHLLGHEKAFENDKFISGAIEAEVAQAGLEFPVALPFYSHQPRDYANREWIRNQATPEMRAIATTITQKMKNIGFPVYLEKVQKNVKEFESAVTTSFVLLVLQEKHASLNSSAWLSSLALSEGKLRWPTAIATADNLTQTLEDNPEVQHIIVWSDCAAGYPYLVRALQKIGEKSTAPERLKQCKLYLSIPFLRTDDYEGIRYHITVSDQSLALDHWFQETVLMPFESIPLLRDILPPQEYMQLDDVTSTLLSNKDITYFDHFVSTDRTLPHLFTGRNLVCNPDFMGEEKLELMESNPVVQYIHSLYQPMSELDVSTLGRKIVAGKVGRRTQAELPKAIQYHQYDSFGHTAKKETKKNDLLHYKIFATLPDPKAWVTPQYDRAGNAYGIFNWISKVVVAKAMKLTEPNSPDKATLEKEIHYLSGLDLLSKEVNLPMPNWIGYKRTPEYFVSVSEHDPHYRSVWDIVFDIYEPKSLCDRYTLARKMAEVLKKFHFYDVCHGDLKLEQFLVDETLETMQLNFFSTHNNLSEAKPERYLRPDSRQEMPLMLQSDIYAFGKMLWKLLRRDLNETNLPREPWDDAGLPLKLAILIQWCLQPDPNKRPTIRQIVKNLTTPIDDVSHYLFKLELVSTQGGALTKFTASQIKMFSMTPEVVLPEGICQIDQAAAKQWVNNQYTPELRMIAQKIVENIHCVTPAEYVMQLRDAIYQFYAKVSGPYAIILTSDEWVARLALSFGMHWPAAFVYYKNLSAFVKKNPHIREFLVTESYPYSLGVIDSALAQANRENPSEACHFDVYRGDPFAHLPYNAAVRGINTVTFHRLGMEAPSLRSFLPPHLHPCIASHYLNYSLSYFPNQNGIANIKELLTGENLEKREDTHYFEMLDAERRQKQMGPFFIAMPAGLTCDIQPKTLPCRAVVLEKAPVETLAESEVKEAQDEKAIEQPKNINALYYTLSASFVSGFPKTSIIYERIMTGVYESNWVGNKVAVKIGKPSSRPEYNLRYSLEKEAGIYIKFNELHYTDLPIPKFYGFGATKDYFMIAIQYFAKGSLDEHFKQTMKSAYDEEARFQSAYHYSVKATRALSFFHKRGLIHRDLKPQNMLVDDNDEVVISDLSSVRFPDDTRNCEGGTYAFMSPESQVPQAPNMKSDIYSLGNIIWRFFANRFPYEGVTIKETCSLVNADKPVAVLSNFPPKVAELINKCRKFKPEERPDCEEVLKELSEEQENYLQSLK